MIFGYFTLLVALTISAVAEYYSIIGLTAIFSAEFWPIVIMGATLAVGKLTAAVWLKLNWSQASWQYKFYLVPAVAFLMLLTSIGCFGYLSKAHSDSSLVSGNVVSKVAVFDEKIKTAKENIELKRTSLRQLDEQVNQTMSRTQDATNNAAVNRSVSIRRSQADERSRLQKEISAEQTAIVALTEQRAPIAAEVRQVEADVGPLKYIAAMVYGDNPDTNLLEKTVRLLIILIVAVFDPLALMLVLAGQQSIKWAREKKLLDQLLPAYQPDDGALTDQQLDQLRESVPVRVEPVEESVKNNSAHAITTHPYLTNPGHRRPSGWESVGPVVVKKTVDVESTVNGVTPLPGTTLIHTAIDEIDEDDAELESMADESKAAARQWKEDHPGQTLKSQRKLFEAGKLTMLPWALPQARLSPDSLQANETQSGFGIAFPPNPRKGDSYIRVDRLPSVLYKFNGTNWIKVNKAVNDRYAHNEAYIDHLIVKLDSGEYDPELLSDAEREQIEQRLIGN
jgi:hypothetical protein